MPHRQLGSVPPPVPPPPAPESYNPSAYRGLVSFFCTDVPCSASFVPVWSEIWWHLVLIIFRTYPFLPAFTRYLFYCFTKEFCSFFFLILSLWSKFCHPELFFIGRSYWLILWLILLQLFEWYYISIQHLWT